MTFAAPYAFAGFSRLLGFRHKVVTKGLYAFLLTMFFLPMLAPVAFAMPPTPPSTQPLPDATGNPANINELRMGVILPGPCYDLSWNQGMCDAVNNFPPLADGTILRSHIAENLNDLNLAEVQAREFLADGTPIILMHGTQYLPVIRKLASEFPTILFIFGSSETVSFSNVAAYDVQPQEGAYLMGMAAGLMTRTNIVSIIAPIDVNEAVGHARGFEEGVIAANPQATINVTYTGTFDDLRLAANLARRSLNDGADILTGSSQQSLGSLYEVREKPGALWAATGYDMSIVAPQTVLASQVYDFRAMLTQMLDKKLKGHRGDFIVPMSLSNGLTHLHWGNNIPDPIRAIIDAKQLQIMQGTFKPDIKTLRYHSIAGY